MGAALVEAFCDALAACGGRAAVVDGDAVATTVASLVREAKGSSSPAPSVVVPPDVEELIPLLQAEGVTASVARCEGDRADGSSLEATLRTADAAVTRGIVGVARSGSVAVGPGGGSGGLLTALLPHHVIVLAEEDVLPTLSEAIAHVATRFEELGGEVAFVSGPSRTADIEMLSVLGVHGPLRVDVVVVRKES